MKDFKLADRKVRLRELSVRLNTELASESCDESLVRGLLSKIRLLITQVQQQLGGYELKRILGIGALLLGMSSLQQAQAQYFGDVNINPYGLIATDGFSVPSFVDLDGDGDFDIMVGEYAGNFEYFENIGSSSVPEFAAPVYNPFGLANTDELAVPDFADLDNDGDFDMIAGESYGALEYFENIGTATAPEFTQALKNPFGLTSTYYNAFPAFADFDEDGDQDLLVGEYYGNFQYFENTGDVDNPEFAAAVENPFGLGQMIEIAVPAVADVDLDGDLDLLVGEKNGFVRYFENEGSSIEPIYKEPVSTPFGIQQALVLAFPAFADLDNDGDADLLLGEDEGKMHFYENTVISSIRTMPNFSAPRVYPSPVGSTMHIKSQENLTLLEVYNAHGQLVLSKSNPGLSIPTKELKPGIYFVRLQTEKGSQIEQKIQKL